MVVYGCNLDLFATVFHHVTHGTPRHISTHTNNQVTKTHHLLLIIYQVNVDVHMHVYTNTFLQGEVMIGEYSTGEWLPHY